jgi:hypothetical protein
MIAIDLIPKTFLRQFVPCKYCISFNSNVDCNLVYLADGKYRPDSGGKKLRWPARSFAGSRIFDSMLIANITVLSSRVAFEPFPPCRSIPSSFLSPERKNLSFYCCFHGSILSHT